MPWRLNIDGKTYDEDDLTLGECEWVEEATGQNWREISPLRTAKHARAIVQVFFTREDATTAEARARTLLASTLLEGFEVLEEDLPTEYLDGIPQ
jgi:hypothetical protein